MIRVCRSHKPSFRGTTMSRPPSQRLPPPPRHGRHTRAATQQLPLQPNTKGGDTRSATTARYRPAGSRPPQRTRTYYVCSNIEQARPDNSPHQKKKAKKKAGGQAGGHKNPSRPPKHPRAGALPAGSRLPARGSEFWKAFMQGRWARYPTRLSGARRARVCWLTELSKGPSRGRPAPRYRTRCDRTASRSSS